MKDIKMSDVFDLPISHDYRNLYNKNGKMIVNACEVQEGDAKAIVLAVNNYDKLVEALKEIHEWKLSLEFRINKGSKGQVNHFREIAKKALNGIES